MYICMFVLTCTFKELKTFQYIKTKIEDILISFLYLFFHRLLKLTVT